MIMGNPFEAERGAVPPRSDRSRSEGYDPTLESLAKLPEQLRQLATDFETAIEPTIAMAKKGDKANWIDTANALYAAGAFALPRIKRGVDLLDRYLQEKQK